MHNAPSATDLEAGSYWVTAQVTLDGAGVEVPVSDGRRVWQADQWPGTQVSGLVLPRFDEEDRDLFSTGLVGSDGHRVRLTAHAETEGSAWTWGLGEYLVTSVKPGEVDLTLEAVDLVELVIRHEAPVPRHVHRSARPVEIMMGLLAEDKIDFYYDPSLKHPRIRDGFAIGTDRGEALKELATIWGVYLYPHEAGGIGAYPLPSGPVTGPEISFSDDPDASPAGRTPIIEAEISLSREEIANHIIVPVRDSEKVAVAYQTTGRYSVHTYGWQSRRIDASTVGHYAEAQGLAKTQLAASLLRTVTRPVEAVPDFRISPYTPVEISTRDAGTQWGRVTGIEEPLIHEETAVYHIGMEL